ncbi:MAG: DHH family phosphoesterase [Synergistaceae bacterium]|jgi:phosphoglycolate phosphatase|nr:DHH family phosphoesterase [Synergistaceae bacterium]
MRLSDIAGRGDIVIQCHDIPDADTIASGFALLCFLESLGTSARLVYGGRNPITKPNLLWMLKLLQIPIEHVEELRVPSLLVTVDCQYGAGNLRRFDAREFAVLDHHRPEIPEGPLVVIQPSLGSCSTLVWNMMRIDGFDFASRPDVFTALYYGLFTDTNGLAEMRHPLDRDLSEFMPVDWTVIKKLKNSALSIDELEVVADTLSSSRMIGNMGLLRSQPCDPNLLGFSSDIAQQVEQFGSCVVYCDTPMGVKLSIRSAAREVMANELAVFLTSGAGSGGGGIEKAGGFISYESIEKIAPGMSPDDFILSRIEEYQNSFDLVYCGNHNIDFSAMRRFRKLPVPLGYAHTADIFPEGTQISVRTLEGDIDTTAGRDTYLMIGISGEAYPIKRERHEKSYEVLDAPYTPNIEYSPVVMNKMTGEKKSALPFARSCVPRGDKIIRAAELSRNTKVFSDWDREKYFYGRAGDYIAAPESDFSDVYIINRGIFGKTYCEV